METLQETPVKVVEEKPLEIRVTARVLKERIQIWEWIALQTGNYIIIRDVLARFVIDPETDDYYTDRRAAYTVVNRLTLADIEKTAGVLANSIQGLAVPKASSKIG